MDGREQAEVILQQLGGLRKLKALVGANTFVYGLTEKKDPYLSFKIKAKSKVNIIKIVLNWRDYYDVELGRTHGLNYSLVKVMNDIDCDNLIEILEKETDLCFQLSRPQA